MRKRFILGVAAAAVAAVVAIGSTRGAEVYHPTYVVIAQNVYPDGNLSCRTVFDPAVRNALAKYDNGEPIETDGRPNNICVTIMNLSEDGLDKLPSEMADLVGLYPAQDANGQTIEFSVYLPIVAH